VTSYDSVETREWIDSLDDVLRISGEGRVRQLLESLRGRARALGIDAPTTLNTPYINTISREHQPPYPGNHDLERRIRNIVLWNAIVMVVRANRQEPAIGGHIATYASAATLFEVAFNHFLRGRVDDFEGDQVFFQAHASPGVYARAFLEGRFIEAQLENFRRELAPGGGLSSYPHPHLMPSFWQFPSASMGLSAIMAIYQARFNRYLEDRGLRKPSNAKVWAFIGDGETDEPEGLGSISLAAREKLDNVIFVINCNLQRLDGPVRGNGKIIQELERVFRGAGWNVIKVIWGSDWDPLIAQDHDGLLAGRMGEIVDGQYQKYSTSSGEYQRRHFFGSDPKLMEMSKQLTDDQIRSIGRGGHDPDKIFAAYKAAIEFKGAPSIVLAKTIKGYGMGEVGEGRMTAHQLKTLDSKTLQQIRTRLGIPICDQDVEKLPFYLPPDDSPETKYLLARRQELGGFVPQRAVPAAKSPQPAEDLFNEFLTKTDDSRASSTKSFVRVLAKLLRDPQFGPRIVPIVADEARTFGMESLFRKYGFYSHVGQLYEPAETDNVIGYRESRDGQLIEEGITEAGALSMFIAAGTSYSTHGVPMLPIFVFYSMFGFQRVGDLIYAAGDCRARGFLIGATSGRTTLSGEGLQHQDGHSHLNALAFPHVVAYEPAFEYELAVILREGIRQMTQADSNVIFYLTVQNEIVSMPPMPADSTEGILRGLYCLTSSQVVAKRQKVNLLGSGALIQQAFQAKDLLETHFDLATDVWSITSTQQLHREGCAAERWNRLHPERSPRIPWIKRCLSDPTPSCVIVSDYDRALTGTIARWFPTPPVLLGTDGFGRSSSRAELRRFFEVDAAHIAFSAISDLAVRGIVPLAMALDARRTLKIDSEQPDPAIC
jgi:pyruvate dehydrogenase E1 component